MGIAYIYFEHMLIINVTFFEGSQIDQSHCSDSHLNKKGAVS